MAKVKVFVNPANADTKGYDISAPDINPASLKRTQDVFVKHYASGCRKV